ncbi:baculoviral IAP repeat-containing protein 5 [Odontomachus brunneus]|uniref:baculoviral IAP repeat-containing protein 5 n=1 Tax=Odontomachus brunneus TaxID=486640 RepID=UPI0013F2008A|nr:baculoviral IAP repeat-containing protein 5 [Odontomachus brunneus]
MEIPEATSFFWKQGRIKTFNNWPFTISDKCNSECMAAAGFYAIGNNDEPDLVECFMCGKQLDGWEPDDDPWDEHVKHQSNCSFVKLNKHDEKEWTVDELYDLYKKFKIKEYMYKLNKNINMIKDEATQLKSELSSLYKTS